MGMNSNTLFVRKEPTADRVLLTADPATKKRDTVLYHDPHGVEVAVRIPWHFDQTTPTKKKRYFTLNCLRLHLVWLPPLEPERIAACP